MRTKLVYTKGGLTASSMNIALADLEDEGYEIIDIRIVDREHAVILYSKVKP